MRLRGGGGATVRRPARKLERELSSWLAVFIPVSSVARPGKAPSLRQKAFGSSRHVPFAVARRTPYR